MTGSEATDDETEQAIETGQNATLDEMQQDATLPDAQAAANNRIFSLDRTAAMAAIRDVFSQGGSLDRETAIREVSQALGFQRLGKNIRTAIAGELRAAWRRGILDHSGGAFSLTATSVTEYTREHLIDTLLAAIGTSWWTRSDAVIAAARYLGFRRTGKNIQAAFKSVINAAVRRGLIERNGTDWIRKAR